MNARQFTSLAFVIACVSVFVTGYAFAQDIGQHTRRGTHACVLCHTTNDKKDELLSKFGSTDFVQLNEIKKWHEKDIHRRSFDLIDPRQHKTGKSNQRSREMCKKLGISTENFGEQANSKSHDCMTCHAGWDSSDFPTGILADSRQWTMGIGCESCHGNSSTWLDKHHLNNWARELKPGQKLTAGMIPLNQPLHLAKNCASCHVGDRSVGRFVTHDMYVAGHPMLPNMEVATFRRAMDVDDTRHWRSIGEKEFPEKQKYKNNHGLHSDFPETEQLIIGAITTFQITTRNLADGKHTDADKPSSLDFAAYDCASCHHELKSKSTRQLRASREISLGRPRPHSWSKLLVDVVLQGDALTTHEAGWRDLCTDLSAAPFGKRDKLTHRQYHEYLAAMEMLKANLAKREDPEDLTKPEERITAERARGILEKLLAIDVVQTPDYFSAKQRADAIVIVATELKAIPNEDLKALQEMFSKGGVKAEVSLS
jgi:hypothetical protein